MIKLFKLKMILSQTPPAGEFSSSLYGSSVVNIGGTKLACGITVLIGSPSVAATTEGEIGNS